MELTNDAGDMFGSMGSVFWGVVEGFEEGIDFGRIDAVVEGFWRIGAK